MTGKEVKELARKLMDQQGLTDWTVRLDPMMAKVGKYSHCLGFCDWDNNEITLSYIHAISHDEYEVRLTILHEIAHALTQSGHDKVWLNKLRALGSDEQSNLISNIELNNTNIELKNSIQVKEDMLIEIASKIKSYLS